MCARGYNSLSYTTLHYDVWSTNVWIQNNPNLVNPISWSFIFSTYWTKFDAKITKMKQNYTANMIMNVSGTVCHLIHYFLSKYRLEIKLLWPALKSKRTNFFWHQLISVDSHLVVIFLLILLGGGEQIFVNSLDGLDCVYKNTAIECHIQYRSEMFEC